MARGKKGEMSEVDVFKTITKGVEGMTTVDHMEEERIVPTLLTSYNRAMGIGGHPLGCLTLVHGPEQVGKTVLALAIAESLRRHGHPSFIYDTEFAGEREWYSAITPKSGYKRTGDLDEFIGDVQTTIDNLQEGKKAKKKADRIPEEVGCVFVCDTLTKLMPANIIEKVKKDGIDRQYPLQAQWVSMFLRSVIPQLYRSNSSMIVVLQERTNVEAKGNQKKYKVTLGKAVQYDNRVRLRVNYSRKVKVGEKVVGMECHYSVENNKIIGTSYEEATFYTSNGKGGVSKGLDLVREAVEEGKARGVLIKKASKVDAVLKGYDKMPELLFSVDGGWADLRERLQGNDEMFGQFVAALNGQLL